jgi:hypothetical protein
MIGQPMAILVPYIVQAWSGVQKSQGAEWSDAVSRIETESNAAGMTT